MPANFCLKHSFMDRDGVDCPQCREDRVSEWRNKPNYVTVEIRIVDNVNSKREIVQMVAIGKEDLQKQSDLRSFMFRIMEQQSNRIVPMFLEVFATEKYDEKTIRKRVT